MSMFNVNIRQVLYIVELAGMFTCTWPVDPNSSKKQIFLRNIRWSFAILNVIFLTISLVFAIFHFRHDIPILMKTASEVTALLEVLFDLILCRRNNAQLQVLIGKVKAFLEVASEHETKAIERYMDRYKQFLSVTAMGYITTAISFSLAPFFSAQELPADGWLPFSTESLGIYCMVYVNQVYCIFQTAFCIGVDFTIAVLFSFSAARLDILRMKLRHVDSSDILVSCIKEHQEIIGFVEDTKATVETLLFKTNATMGSAVICGAFPLIYNQSLAVMSQYLSFVVSGCTRLYVISWPADDLKESSVQFAKSITDVQWLGKPKNMKSSLLIMMQRSQKPLLIRMSGLLPPLTLEYFANIFCFKILQICSGISGCLLFMPILYSIYLHLNDIVITSSCMCLLLGVSQNIFQTLICFIKHDSLQRTVEEMMTYVREAQQYEKKIFYKYIKKCYVFCGGSMACTYVTATCFSLRPIVLPVSLPFDAEYPFPINYTSMYVIIYVHHVCLCIQTAALVCVSSFGALLLWFTVARFECLAAELERSTNIDALVVCVKKQLHLKRYAEEVFNSFRFLVLYAIGVATFGITLCFLMVLINVPLFVKLQFIGVCVTVLTEIYLYAWPADYLKDMSMDAPQSIYNSTWYEQKLGMQKSLLNVLIYRQPLTLSIACIVPELSLRYYCSYLSNAFSIFTTLRVMIHD